jgi:chemotaxis family two-component system response regulator Rcp1
VIMTATADRPLEILLVEDNPGDADLMRESLAEVERPHHLSVVEEGEEAIAFLRRESQYADALRPDLILLDLNLPRKDGRQVLAEIKADDHLKRIPVLVLTTSRTEEDVRTCYDLHANCYITKPRQFDEYHQVVKRLEEFWFVAVTLPPGEQL